MQWSLVIALAWATSPPADQNGINVQENWVFLNMQNSYREVEYNIEWEMDYYMSTMSCRGHVIPTENHRIEAIRRKDCRNFCKDPANMHNEELCKQLAKEPLSSDQVFASAVCVEFVEDVQNLCALDHKCSSVEIMDNYGGYGFGGVIGLLHDYDCLTDYVEVTSNQWWKKKIVKNHECDFGVGLAIRNTTRHPETHGLYVRSNTECTPAGDPQITVDRHQCESYEKIAELDETQQLDSRYYRVGFSDQCGWIVQSYAGSHGEKHNSHVTEAEWERACKDRPELLEGVWGQSIEGYPCSTLASTYGCSYSDGPVAAVIGAACPNECFSCDSTFPLDYVTHIEAALAALGEEPWASYANASTIHDALQHIESDIEHQMLSDTNRVDHHRRLFTLKNTLESLGQDIRRLHGESKDDVRTILVDDSHRGDKLDFYSAFKDPLNTDNCATYWASANADEIEKVFHDDLPNHDFGSGDYYDLTTLNDAADITVDLDCPDSFAKKFYPMHGKYCSRSNVNTLTHPARCQIRCHDPSYTGPEIPAGDQGIVWNETNFMQTSDEAYKWCSGLGDEFIENVHGLCAPYEECEQFCNDDPACHSFDMHRFKPLCYLNTYACNADDAPIRAQNEWTVYVRSDFNPVAFYPDVYVNQIDGFMSFHWSVSRTLSNRNMANYPFKDGSFTAKDRIARGTYEVHTGKRVGGIVTYRAVDRDPSLAHIWSSPDSPLRYELNELINYNYPGNGNTSVHGTTANCQYLCSNSPSCAGFEASIESTAACDGSDELQCFGSICEFFDHDQNITLSEISVDQQPFYSVHFKREPECTATVSGAAIPAAAQGAYELERFVGDSDFVADRDYTLGSDTARFINADSTYSIGLMSQTSPYKLCGWNLEANTETIEKNIEWCEDDVVGAKHVYEFLGGDISSAAYINDWVCDQLIANHTCTSSFVASVCHKSCETPALHQDVLYGFSFYGEREIGADPNLPALECGLDQNLPLNAIVADISAPLGSFQDVNGTGISTGVWQQLESQSSTIDCYSLTISFDNSGTLVHPCFEGHGVFLGGFDMSKLVNAFCPMSCKNAVLNCQSMADAGISRGTLEQICPVPPYVHIPDEAHPEGANARRADTLDFSNFSYSDMNWGYSLNSRDFYQDVVANTEWNRQTTNWQALARNFEIDTSFTCHELSSSTEQRSNLASNSTWSNWTVSTDTVTFSPICAKAKQCAPYTTCVYSEFAFINAIEEAANEGMGILPRAWVTESRAVGLFTPDYPDANLMRQGGQTWLEFTNVSSEIIVDVLDYSSSMSRYHDIDMPWPAIHLSYSFIDFESTPELHDEPQSDIISIQGTADFKVFTRRSGGLQALSDEEVKERVRLVPVLPPSSGVDATVDVSPANAIAPSDVNPDAVVFSVSTSSDGSWVVVLDVDECAQNNGAPRWCDPNPKRARCINNFAAPPACECNAGFIQQPTEDNRAIVETHCVRPSHSPKDMDFLIRLTPSTGVEHGLRVKRVEVCWTAADGDVCEGGLNNDIWVSGSFPSYIDDECLPENMFKLDDSTWCSERMRYSYGEVWIEFIVRGEQDFDYIRIEQEDRHSAVSFDIELSLASGYVDLLECGYLGDRQSGYRRGDNPRCPPLATWTSTGVETRTVIGEAQTLIEGELVEPLLSPDSFGTQGSLWDAADGVTIESMSKLRCLAQAVELFAQGAETWAYLDLPGMRHCQVGRTPNANGYYGVTRVTAEHWFSGEVPPFVHFMMVNEQYSSAQSSIVQPDTRFSITLRGVSFHNPERMKIKVMRSDQGCTDRQPQEVDGYGCTGNDESGWVFCNKVPDKATATRNSVTFSGLKIQQTDSAQTYKVCVCTHVDCFHQSKWSKVFGELRVPKSEYTWHVSYNDYAKEGPFPNHEATEIPRRIQRDGQMTATKFELRIQRPLWSTDSSEVPDWELKIVRERFGCNVEHNMDKFECTYANSGSGYCEVFKGTQVTEEAAVWSFSTDLESEDVGSYLVCFRTGSEQVFKPIPSFNDVLTLNVNAIPQDRKTLRGIFHNQHYSAQSGRTNTISVAGTNIPTPTLSRIALRKHSKADNVGCGDNSDWTFKPCDADDCDSAVDETRPQFLPEYSFPSSRNPYTLPGDMSISFKFDERLSSSSFGSFYLVPDNGGVEQTIAESYGVSSSSDVTNFNGMTFSSGDGTGYFTSLSPIFYFEVTSDMIKDDTLLFTPYLHAKKPVFSFDFATNSVQFVEWSSEVVRIYLKDGETYHLRTNGEGMVEDDSGNKLLPLNTRASSTWTVRVGTDTSLPKLLRYDLDGNRVVMHMSRPVQMYTSGSAKTFRVTMCGDDQDCTREDDAQYSFDQDIAACDFSFTMFDESSVPCEHAIYATRNLNLVTLRLSFFPLIGKGFRIFIPAATIAEIVDGSVSDALTLYFDQSSYEQFQYANSVGTSSASADSLTFDIDLHASVNYANRDDDDKNAFEYSVCYCNDQDDTTLINSNAPDAKFFPRWTDNARCASADDYIDPSEMIPKWQAHQCSAKCDQGCSGRDCFCDGNAQEMNDPKRLCLPADMCWQACVDHNLYNADWDIGSMKTCKGIDVSKVQDNVCWLIIGNDVSIYDFQGTAIQDCDFEEDENTMHANKVTGTPCTDAADFSEYAGKLVVTDRALLGVDYVFEPGQPQSVEVFAANGNSLTYDPHAPTDYRMLLEEQTMQPLIEPTLSKDRIMVIDCKGTCGVSGPAGAVEMGDDVNRQDAWNQKVALNYFIDPAHTSGNGSEAAYNGPLMPVVTRYDYVGSAGYCDGNLDVRTTTVYVGTETPIAEYRGCENPRSPGHVMMDDQGTSNALCALPGESPADFQDTVEELCDRLGPDTCRSYDLRNDGFRAYLNTPNCVGDNVQPSPAGDMGYMHYTREGEREPRRLRDAAGNDDVWFYSWSQKLRFHNILFSSGGTFKVCFCDHTMIGHACSTEADYKVEIGKIHVTGISCLLNEPRFRKSVCERQLLGGLSCFKDGVTPPQVTPPALDHVEVRAVVPESEVPLSVRELFCSVDGQGDSQRDCKWLIPEDNNGTLP